MSDLATVIQRQLTSFSPLLINVQQELTLEIARDDLFNVMTILRHQVDCQFDGLMDICAVDYLLYGVDEWTTDKATETSFDRGVERSRQLRIIPFDKPRFAVVYHLLSYQHNHRLRVKVRLTEADLVVDSMIELWPAANWFEREAFDLYGILFKNHPDLRRILTDYGFIGHPFRKDFPISGTVEVRYDAAQKRVIYEAVNIEPRVLTPKVIREDNRYLIEQAEKNG